MHFIAHRGNISHKNIERENSPDYIQEALELGFDVEVDLRIVRGDIPPGEFFLGHDYPEHSVSLDWLLERKNKLWIHAKNIDALSWCLRSLSGWNVFWHQKDDFTITSKGYIWAYPGQHLASNSICVLPERSSYDNINCAGICSDFISSYRKRYSTFRGLK